MVHGKQLRLLREQAGLHRGDLAANVGCSVGHLKNIELETDKDRNQPSAVLVQRILRVLAAHLGRPVDVDEFSTTADRKAAA